MRYATSAVLPQASSKKEILMRVLLIGSGAREHAIATALCASPKLSELFIAPGNPGTAALGTNIDIEADDIAQLVEFARTHHIDLVIPGPEAPLVEGITDACAAQGIACAGPTKAAAQLEGSKQFTKMICDEAQIPTAKWQRFTKFEDALAYIEHYPLPVVIKADGLAAGKGVIIAQTKLEAQDAISSMMAGKTVGEAGKTIVIEEFLQGEEVSLFAFCTEKDAFLIGAAQDHKRIGENDTGPNTGGMGAITPPPFFDKTMQEQALDITVRPMLEAMVKRGTPFCGIIFAGLMLTQDGPKLIEYNVRLGDPEAQALLLRLKSDLLEAFWALAQGHLTADMIRFSDEYAVSIVLAGKGYPGTPSKGSPIVGVQEAQDKAGVKIFQAATAYNDQHQLIGNGGRVLSICAQADTLEAALQKAYAALPFIHWKDAVWRNDIGQRALSFTYLK